MRRYTSNIYVQHDSLWSETNKNRDVSTGLLARPFARSLALLTRSLAPDCSLRSRPLLRSLVHSLAHFTHSLARGTVNDLIAILSVFFSIFDHSGLPLFLGSLRSHMYRIFLTSPNFQYKNDFFFFFFSFANK